MAKKQLAFSLPFRQIHLDFHTGPWIPDVGRDFDAKAFAKTMKAAHINSVTLFAKCHHGHLYYNTKHPARHPGLAKGLDLLAEQVEALHREGIRAPIYLSVQCDEYAADTHPEWIARNPDGSLVGAKPLEAGWQILDMSSPYQDYLYEQTAEVLKLFKPVDGIFYDMCWDQPSVSNYAVEGMIKENLNPESEADRAKYSNLVAHRYMKRYFQQVKAASKEATVWFNSRPFPRFAEEVAYQTQAEIEALPTGGWGYMYFPVNVRFARTFDMPYLGMTARFHKSWADFGGLKPYPALEYETAQMMAHGARCSVGDQLHPRGILDKAAYEVIGKAYQRVEEREPWLDGASPQAQIGLFRMPSNTNDIWASANKADEGATRILTHLKHQFDVVVASSDFNRYELLVLPDALSLSPELLKKLRAYLKQGGKILASGLTGLNAEGTEVLLPELGIAAHGMSPYQTTYLRFGAEVGQDVPPSDHVCYDRTVRVTPTGKAAAVCKVVEPYFDRNWQHFSSHFQTPPDRVSRFAAAVENGNTAYVAFPVFSSFAEHGNIPYRLLVRNLLNRLLPEPLLKVDGPSYLEATLMQQTAHGKPRQIVHLLAYSAERRTAKLDILEDIVPLHDISISLKLSKAPKSVYLAPTGTPLAFAYQDGYAVVKVPQVVGHAMVVFE